MGPEMARTEAAICAALKAYQMAAHPRLRDYTPISVLTAINGAIASQVRFVELQNDNVAAALSIWTASGADLDLLVLDRLLDGRYAGDYATGTLVFFRRSPATVDYVVPVGTKVACPNDLGIPLEFVTTEAGTLVAGTNTITLAARCFVRGTQGNAPETTVNKLVSPIIGIEGVTNPAAFSGGTDEETDDELQQRYVDTAALPGTATRPMLEAKLADLETIIEAKIWNREEGDVEIICDDTEGVEDDSVDIDDCLELNLAGGAVSRGIVGATLGVANVYDVADCYGGKIWIRAREHLTDLLDFELTYIDMDGNERTATVETTGIIPRGTAFQATLEDPDDRAVSIHDSTYVGAQAMDVLLGMGVYPRLYNLPEHVVVDVALSLILTETPETDLENLIVTSITDFLNSFKIGIFLDWSDLFKVVNNLFVSNGEDGEVTTGRAFVGIDAVTVLSSTAPDQTCDELNEIIDVEDDARIECGTVTLTVVTAHIGILGGGWVVGKVVNETPDGIITTFTVPDTFIANSERVYLNGFVQLRNVDYTPTPETGTIEVLWTPLPNAALGDVLWMDYIKDDVYI